MAFDRWLMPRTAGTSGTARTGFGMVLEVAYLFCYPLVPLGLLALYVVGQRDHAAGFWLVVLMATYLCYAITPFVPAYPPRDLAGGQPVSAQTGKARVFNRWILKHGSIHAISFPSAHVWCCSLRASCPVSSGCLLRFHCRMCRGVSLFCLYRILIAIGRGASGELSTMPLDRAAGERVTASGECASSALLRTLLPHLTPKIFMAAPATIFCAGLCG